VIIVSHDSRLKEIADRVLWLEDGRFRELQGLVTDPVCQMPVDPAEAVSAEIDGVTHWFCSTFCRDEYTADPDRSAPD
jgi:putative ABC transport system ATP-binding protein